MSFEATIIAHPWDFFADDPGVRLDFASGVLGANGITLLAGSAPGMFLFTTPEEDVRAVRTRGGLFHSRDDAFYTTTRLKPTLANNLRGSRPLEKIVEGARSRNMTVRLSVTATRLGRLADQNPAYACKNVFGLPLVDTLCLSNPDVVEMIAGMVAELSGNFDPDGIELTDFVLGSTGESSDTLPEEIHDLLGVCFCESCCRRLAESGADVEGARSAIQQTIWDVIHGEPGMLGEPVSRIASYREHGYELTTEAFERIRKATDKPIALCARHHRSPEDIAPSLLQLPDAWVIEYRRAHASLVDILRYWSDGLPAETSLQCAISGRVSPEHSAPVLVSEMKDAVTAGFTTFHIADPSWSDSPTADAIRQAIRFARRTSEE